MELLNEVYLLSKFDISSFSMSGDIDFQANHLANFEGFKIDSSFADFGQVKIDPYCLLLLSVFDPLVFQ